MTNYPGFDPRRGQQGAPGNQPNWGPQQGQPGYDPRYGQPGYPPQQQWGQQGGWGQQRGPFGQYPPQYGRPRGGNNCLAQAIGALACAECMNGCDFLSLMALFKIATGVTRSTSRVDSPATSRAARAARRVIRSYQVNVSAVRDHTVCKSSPSCSAYGMQAIETHGAVRGGQLTAQRLWRCGHGQTGADPVPGR